jgi:nitroreductase
MDTRRADLEEYTTNFLSASVYVVVLVDKESQYPDYNVHDGPLAVGSLMLAARSLGYGTAYGTDAVPGSVLRKVFKIPSRYRVICITPIGIPVEWPAMPEKKDLDSFLVYEVFDEA